MTQITVPDVPTFKEYSVVVSSTGPFIVPFAFFDEDDVKATVTDALGAVSNLVVTTDFTFTQLDTPVGQEGTGYEGGEITLLVAIGADGGTTIRIYRDTTIDRVANYAATGQFLIPVLNDEQNKFIMMMQELSENVSGDQVGINTQDIADQAALIANLTANDPGGSYALLTNLASVLNGKGASLIGYEDAAGDFAATDVEAAIAELKAELDVNVADIATNAADIATNAADILTNATAIGLGIGVSKVKLADETRTSDTTMTADDTLFGWSMVAGGIYKIEGFLSLYTYPTPRWKCRFQASETMQDSSMLMIGIDGSPAQEYEGGLVSILNPAIFLTVPNGLVTAHITLRGQVKWHASNPGTMDFEWAQNVSDANITRLQEGSWITVTRIG